MHLTITTSSYVYVGDTFKDMPHGHGVYQFTNGDVYTGDSNYGMRDGYGVFKSDAYTYEGFFSNNLQHGIGTYYATNCNKGPWRCGKRHGMHTVNCAGKTYKKLYIHDICIDSIEIQLIPNCKLKTHRIHPKYLKHTQHIYKGDAQCLCCDNPAHSCNVVCGHVCLCYNCALVTEYCPMCRAPMDNIIKLYTS